jgi:elongation factor P
METIEGVNLRLGMVIEEKGEFYLVTSFEHIKPGKGGAFVRLKLKRLSDSVSLNRTIRPEDKFKLVYTERKEAQFLYKNSLFHFMNMENYEEINLLPEVIGDKKLLLKEGDNVYVVYARISEHKTEILDIELPSTVVLEVVETEPGFRGDTVQGATKPATLETGLTIQVPLFIEVGDKIVVNTESKTYVRQQTKAERE